MRVLIALVLVVIILVACNGTTGNAVQEEVVIGAVLPLTGRAANYGQWVRNGIDFANEVHDVTIIYQDSKCDPKAAISAYNAVRMQGANLVIGAGCSQSTLAIAPRAEADKALLLTAVSSSPEISHAGDYIFRDNTKATSEADRMIDYLEYEDVVILYDATNDAYEHMSQYMVERFATARFAFTGGNQDYHSELLKVQAENPDAIYILALTPDAILLVKQMQELGIDLPIISGKPAGTPEFVAGVGELGEGIIYAVASYDETINPEFWQAYEEQYGEEPSVQAAQGYDALNMFVLATDECGDDTACVRDWLYNVKDYPGAAGITNFDENGDAIKEIAIMQIQNGKFARIQ